MKSEKKKIFERTTYYAKSLRIRNFSGPHFPAFGLNEERYEVSLLIYSECGNTSYLSVFRPKAGKYGPEKLRLRILFTL